MRRLISDCVPLAAYMSAPCRFFYLPPSVSDTLRCRQSMRVWSCLSSTSRRLSLTISTGHLSFLARYHIQHGQGLGRSWLQPLWIVRVPGCTSHSGAWQSDACFCTQWPRGHQVSHCPRRCVSEAPKFIECQHHAMMCTGVTESPLHRTQLESLRLDWD